MYRIYFKTIISSVVLFFCFSQGFGQVAKKVVVEHFTNSVCSACASRNPAFYSNLNQQADVLHLAIHPSSPYSSCLINKHNKTENDGRTNYYGIYGGTPRLVIQGQVVSTSANYGSSTIFSSHLNQTSPISLKINHTKFGLDSIQVRVVITTEASHNLGNVRLFLALAEDTLFYNSPNGESKHYDVFRKTLTSTSGMLVALPAAIGDSLVYTEGTTVHADWNFSRIFALAILQEESNKAVVQAEKSTENSSIILGVNSVVNNEISLYPNPAKDFITLEDVNKDAEYSITSIGGRIILSSKKLNSNTIDIRNLDLGIYILTISSKEKMKHLRFMKL